MAKKGASGTNATGTSTSKTWDKVKKILLIVLVLLLVVGLSVGGTWFFLGHGSGKKESAEDAESATTQDKQPAIYEELEPAFVVNFTQNGRARYMQVSVALMVRDQAALDALKVHMPVLRNNLVMLFSSQDFSSLMTPIGKELLRQQATSSVQELAQKEIGKLVVERVLFTNFVLQ